MKLITSIFMLLMLFSAVSLASEKPVVTIEVESTTMSVNDTLFMPYYPSSGDYGESCSVSLAYTGGASCDFMDFGDMFVLGTCSHTGTIKICILPGCFVDGNLTNDLTCTAAINVTD